MYGVVTEYGLLRSLYPVLGIPKQRVGRASGESGSEIDMLSAEQKLHNTTSVWGLIQEDRCEETQADPTQVFPQWAQRMQDGNAMRRY